MTDHDRPDRVEYRMERAYEVAATGRRSPRMIEGWVAMLDNLATYLNAAT